MLAHPGQHITPSRLRERLCATGFCASCFFASLPGRAARPRPCAFFLPSPACGRGAGGEGSDETLGTKRPQQALFHRGLTHAHGLGASRTAPSLQPLSCAGKGFVPAVLVASYSQKMIRIIGFSSSIPKSFRAGIPLSSGYFEGLHIPKSLPNLLSICHSQHRSQIFL